MLAALAASRDRQRRLVADAGHELRTPLTSLRTNLDLLAQADGSPDLPAEARAELLSDVRAQIEELTTLIGDLVELAREEPMAHVVEPVDLAEVVDRAVARVRRRAPGHRLRRRGRPVVGRRGGLGPRARGDQPARQRREVEPARRRRHRPHRRRRAHRRRRGPGHLGRRPAARVRPVLPRRGVPLDARLGPGALDRPPGGRAARRLGHAPDAARRAAPGSPSALPGSPAPPEPSAHSARRAEHPTAHGCRARPKTCRSRSAFQRDSAYSSADVGVHRDPAAGAEQVAAVAGGHQRPDHHAEVGAPVGGDPAERAGVRARAGCSRPAR